MPAGNGQEASLLRKNAIHQLTNPTAPTRKPMMARTNERSPWRWDAVNIMRAPDIRTRAADIARMLSLPTAWLEIDGEKGVIFSARRPYHHGDREILIARSQPVNDMARGEQETLLSQFGNSELRAPRRVNGYEALSWTLSSMRRRMCRSLGLAGMSRWPLPPLIPASAGPTKSGASTGRHSRHQQC